MQRAVSGVIPQNLFWRKKRRRWKENKKHPRGYSGDADDISQGMMGENSGRENEQVLESTKLGEVKLSDLHSKSIVQSPQTYSAS